MNTFKRKALVTAVVAGLGVAAGSAEAVYLNPNKTGQVLIFPYSGTNQFSCDVRAISQDAPAKSDLYIVNRGN